MPDITPRLGLRKPWSNEAVTRAAYNENIDIIDQNTVKTSDLAAHLADYVRQPGYAVAVGSANTYAINLDPALTAYTEGVAVSLKINVDNTGAATININSLGAKAIKKANGNDISAGNLKAGSVYTLRYNGVNFILQGEGGGGTAQPGEVLTGKTFTNDTGDQTGTMPNQGQKIITPSASNQTILAGYHDGTGYVVGDADLVTGNIKAGVNLFGVNGKSSVVDTADSTIPQTGGVSSYIIAPYTAYVNGVKVTGDMPNRGAYNITPGTSNVTIPTGYHSGGVVYGDADLVANNIKSGVNIFGVNGNLVPGSIVNSVQRGSIDINSSTSADVTINSVDMTKSIVIISQTPDVLNDFVAGKLISNTNLRLNKRNNEGSYVEWQVIEFNANIMSVQHGEYSLTTTSGTATISPVNLNKSFLIFSYSPLGVTYNANAIPSGNISASNSISFNSIGLSSLIYWHVVEFS